VESLYSVDHGRRPHWVRTLGKIAHAQGVEAKELF
jgi:hypothetical protein